MRNHSLDGLRGCLAVVVLADHVALLLGHSFLVVPARAAVWTFFVLSGLVLTRSWDGHFGWFLIRRFIRLWPVYAVCMSGAYALSGIPPDPWQFLWIPLQGMPPPANSAAWSLTVEAAAMLGMPLYVAVGRAEWPKLVIALLLIFLTLFITPYAFFGAFFLIGAWLARFDIRLPLLDRRAPQWLGRISYPLYLCHVPIITFSGLPLWASIPLAFAVAEILTRTVEKWSLDASRAITRRAWPRHQLVEQVNGRAVQAPGL